jgi:hypothetical protein
MNKILNYNLNSSKKYGWSPEWFGCDIFNEELIEKIKVFQSECNIKVDGLVEPGTLRRKETELLELEDHSPVRRRKRAGDKFIVYNNKKFPIAWDKVILWNDKGGLKSKEGTYYDWSGRPDRAPTQFVNHWDATFLVKLARVL